MFGADEKAGCPYGARLGLFCLDHVRWRTREEAGRVLQAGDGARREESLTSKEFSACVAIAIHEPDGVVCAVVKGLPCRRPSRPARGSGSGVLFDDEW